MEKFRPDTLYENKKYKGLVKFYELGTGSLDRNKKSRSSHRTFMERCLLVIRLMAENELWMKYETYSLIRAKRMKLYVHHNIVHGLSIIHDDRVVNLFFDCKDVEDNLKRYIFGSHLQIVDEDLYVESRKFWDEDEFFFFNNSTAEYLFEKFIREMNNEEPRQILQPEVTDQRYDGVVTADNGHDLQPERFADHPICLPEEIFPEPSHETPSLPLDVPDGSRSRELEPTSVLPEPFRDDTSRAGQLDFREPCAVEREDLDRIIVLTDEEYKEMRKKEAEADQKKRAERQAEQKLSRPEEKRPTYRELVYGPETSSDEDEPRNRLIAVTVELHADPTLSTTEDHRQEVAPPNIFIRPPSPEIVIDPRPSVRIPTSAFPDSSIRHPSPSIDLPPPGLETMPTSAPPDILVPPPLPIIELPTGPETIPRSAPPDASVRPPSPIIELPSGPETMPMFAPPNILIRPPSPIIEPPTGRETIPRSAPPDASVRPPSPIIELPSGPETMPMSAPPDLSIRPQSPIIEQPPPVPEKDLERPVLPGEIGKRKKHRPKSDPSKKRKPNPNRKKCQYATSTLKRKYNRKKPLKPYFAPLEIMDLIDWHLIEKVLNHFDVRYMYDENYKFEDLDYDDINNILRFVELGSPPDFTLVEKYEDCAGNAAPAMWHYISGEDDVKILDSDDESIEGVDELILWDIVRLDTEKARNSEWCRLFIQDVQKSWNAGRTSLQRGRKSPFLSMMAETLRKELDVPERPRGSVAQPTLVQVDLPHFESERAVPQQRGGPENLYDPRNSEMTLAASDKSKTTTYPPNSEQVPMEEEQPEVIQPPPPIQVDMPRERVSDLPPMEKDVEMPRETLEPVLVPFTNEPIHIIPEEGRAILENGGKRSLPQDVPEGILPKKRRDHTKETEPAVDIPVEPSMNDLISVELPAGVFIGEFQGTRVDIPCALPIEASTTDPAQPETTGVIEPRQSLAEEEAVEPRPRIDKSAVLRNIDEIYQENEEPVHISRLCPEETTSKSVAAAVFHRLLFLRKDRKITLEQPEVATTLNNIFIRPIS